MFLFAPNNMFGFRQNVFERLFMNYLSSWKSSDFIVIDEIGGKEILNNYIFNSLKELSSTEQKKVIVYKNDNQFGAMFKRFVECPSQPLLYRRTQLEQVLKTNSNFVVENLETNLEEYISI